MSQLGQTDAQPAAAGKSSYTYEELLDRGHARLFGTGNAQLRYRPC